MTIREALDKVVKKKNLTRGQMRECFGQIMNGKATPSQVAAFVTALRMKGETAEEITGAADVMREKCVKIKTGGRVIDIDREDITADRETILDTCGTGGSGTNTFNISTTVAFVVAACGVRVAKHGNRSASSRCGSADVLEKLGVRLDVTPDRVKKCIDEIGIGFLYAPLYHGAMKHAAVPRKEIGIRTIFNVLGPLSNPAGATRQVMGVYRRDLVPVQARVLKNLGCRRALIVHGLDNLDEITITGRTYAAELKNGRIRTYFLDPSDFGLRKAALDKICGGGAEENAEYVSEVLLGKRGPRRDIVLMNASAALVVAGKAGGFKAGVRFAACAIDSGSAIEKLNRLKVLTGRK